MLVLLDRSNEVKTPDNSPISLPPTPFSHASKMRTETSHQNPTLLKLDPNNMFAILTPWDRLNLAREAFNLPAKSSYYFSAAEVGITKEPIIGSRQATPATKVDDPLTDCILLQFDRKEWHFGTNRHLSDVRLGCRGSKGISGDHFIIKVNPQLRVEVHDNSTHGTAVGYNGQEKPHIFKNDRRLLSFEPGATQPWSEVIIYVPGPGPKWLAFRIEFPWHHTDGRECHEKFLACLQATGRTFLSHWTRLGKHSSDS